MGLESAQKCKVFRQIFYGKLYTRDEKATVFEGGEDDRFARGALRSRQKQNDRYAQGSLCLRIASLKDHFVWGKSKMTATAWGKR